MCECVRPTYCGVWQLSNRREYNSAAVHAVARVEGSRRSYPRRLSPAHKSLTTSQALSLHSHAFPLSPARLALARLPSARPHTLTPQTQADIGSYHAIPSTYQSCTGLRLRLQNGPKSSELSRLTHSPTKGRGDEPFSAEIAGGLGSVGLGMPSLGGRGAERSGALRWVFY